jgi:hypothetical protein
MWDHSILRPPGFKDHFLENQLYMKYSIYTFIVWPPAICNHFYSDLGVVTYCRDHCNISENGQQSLSAG